MFPAHISGPALALLAPTCCATAQIQVFADKLDSSDGLVMPPPHIVVVDFSIDVSASPETFVGEGIAAGLPTGGRLVYAHDDQGNVLITAPGTANRFVTFGSKPRARDADARFGLGAGIAPEGRYCHFGEIPILLPDLIDVVMAGVETTDGRDGYIMRVAIDLSGVLDPQFQQDSDRIVVASEPPPNSYTIFETRCDVYDGGYYVQGRIDTVFTDFGVYGIIPEPSAALGSLAGALVFARRRR